MIRSILLKEGLPHRMLRISGLRNGRGRDTGAVVQILRGIRLCLTGVMAMLPETAGDQEVTTAVSSWTVSTEVSKKIFEKSAVSWNFAWLVALMCGGLALWCWMRISTTRSTQPLARSTLTQTMARCTQTMARSREEWLEMTIETLRARCVEKGIGTSGTKDKLTERLMQQRQMDEALSALHGGV